MNAPHSANNGVLLPGGVDMVTALCHTLGYASGVVVREEDGNYCPEAHAVTADGATWASDYADTIEYGAEYQCIGFLN